MNAKEAQRLCDYANLLHYAASCFEDVLRHHPEIPARSPSYKHDLDYLHEEIANLERQKS